MSGALTDEELAFLQAAFDLARGGETLALLAQVDAGLPANLTNGSGDTLLILAAYHLHADLVRGLLDRGADTARVNDKGQTALGAAVFRQSKEIVMMLLAAGADPAGGTRTALEIAQFFELPALTSLLEVAPPAG